MNDNILTLNNSSLKYVITKNRNVIDFLSKTGSLIAYEPSNEDGKEIYRELWISNYFLASGFGAQSRDEQNKLSDIAENYDNTYAYFNNQINNAFSYAHNLYEILDNNKVSKGTEDKHGDDISYNEFNFGGDIITLSDLYNKFLDINVLYKFEIYNVQYFVKFVGDSNEYPNFSNVPTGAKLETIKIIITGNTKDSGGIDNIEVDLYNQYDNSIFKLKLEDFNNISEIPDKSNTQFTFILSKTFITSGINKEEYEFIIQNTTDGKNYIIKNIQITTNPTKDSNVINPISAEVISDITEKFPTYYYSTQPIYVYSNILDNKHINLYQKHLVSSQYELNIFEKNAYGDNNKINHISILISNNVNLRLIDAQYYDMLTCKKYDIIDFILTNYNYTPNGTNSIYDVEYQINITNNANYISGVNPPFLHYEDDEQLYMNYGKILFTFIESSNNINTILKNTYQYWISYNDNDNIPLT